MKLRNYDILGIMSSLNEFEQKKLPQKISYAITKNQILLSNEIVCYQKELDKLIAEYDEYFEKDEEGNNITDEVGLVFKQDVDESYKNEFYENLNILLNMENEVELFLFDEELLNYDDNNNYDVLTPREISYMQRVLCKK